MRNLTPVERAVCHEGVTRRGEYQPCDRPAVGLATDPEEGGDYPVCPQHIRRGGVPLAEVLARHETEVRARVMAVIRALPPLLTSGPDRYTDAPVIADTDLASSDPVLAEIAAAAYERGRADAIRVAEGSERRE